MKFKGLAVVLGNTSTAYFNGSIVFDLCNYTDGVLKEHYTF